MKQNEVVEKLKKELLQWHGNWLDYQFVPSCHEIPLSGQQQALRILRIMLGEMNCVRLVTPYHYEVSPKAHEAFKLAQEVQDAGKQKN